MYEFVSKKGNRSMTYFREEMRLLDLVGITIIGFLLFVGIITAPVIFVPLTLLCAIKDISA